MARAVDALRGGVARHAALLALGDAWFALAPALVLVATRRPAARLRALAAYLAALAAQLVFDVVGFVARGCSVALGCRRRALRSARCGSPTASTCCWRRSACSPPFAAADQPIAALLVLPLVSLLRSSRASATARIEHSLELGRAYRGTALLLRDLLEEDDEYTGHHTEDVVELTVRVAEQMGVDEDTRREAEIGALLHDIGKIAMPDEIINKPGPLDDEEWAIMKTHTVEGERMLDQVGGLLASVGLVVRASHERWDGGGYPDGLAGEAIPLAARIVSACDAFNAMTTDRSYRKALPLEVAVARAARQRRHAVRPRRRRRARRRRHPWRSGLAAEHQQAGGFRYRSPAPAGQAAVATGRVAHRARRRGPARFAWPGSPPSAAARAGTAAAACARA